MLSSSFIKSLNRETLAANSVRAELHGFSKIDFKEGRFDGEYRESLCWIRYLQDLFNEKSLSYLFDPAREPNIRPDYLYARQRQEIALELQSLQDLAVLHIGWEAIPAVAAYLAQGVAIMVPIHGVPNPFRQAMELQHLQARAALVLLHPEPAMARFQSRFTAVHAGMIKNYERIRDKEETDAQSALGIMKAKLGTVCTTALISSWDNDALSSAVKARGTWDYIQQFLHTNIDTVMVSIDQDFVKIPPVKTPLGAKFAYLKMVKLQEDCTRVGRPKTDVDLISKMRGKLQGDAFIHLNVTLRNLEDGQNVVPVVRMEGMPVAAVVPPPPPLTWEQFGRQLHILADESTKQSKDMSTVLQEGEDVKSLGIDLEILAERQEAYAEDTAKAFSAWSERRFDQDRAPRSILRTGSRQE